MSVFIMNGVGVNFSFHIWWVGSIVPGVPKVVKGTFLGLFNPFVVVPLGVESSPIFGYAVCCPFFFFCKKRLSLRGLQRFSLGVLPSPGGFSRGCFLFPPTGVPSRGITPLCCGPLVGTPGGPLVLWRLRTLPCLGPPF